VLERSHDLITVTDAVGTIVYASPSWQAVLGWDPDELVGTPILELVHPNEQAAAASWISDVIGGDAVGTPTVRVRALDGRWVVVETMATPLVDGDGRVTHLLGTARDVTEREELRRRVGEVDALYRIADAIARSSTLDELFAEALETLVEATAADRAGILLLDDANVMRFVAWTDLSDRYRAATEGHTPWAPDAVDPAPVIVADASAGGFEPKIAEALADERIASLAFIPLVLDGMLVGKFMLYSSTPRQWSDRQINLCGKIANHLASATVRTRARLALRESREQLEAIMRTVDEGIVVQSATGGIVYANDSAARFVGFDSADDFLAADRAEVIDRFEMLDEEGRPLPPDELPGRRALRGEGGERVIRYRVKATGEERWSIVRANPVSAGSDAPLAVSVIHDVTEWKLVEERVKFLGRASELLNATLDVEQTLAAIAELAVPAFASHVTVDLYRDGALTCVGARHVDPDKTRMMIELRREYPPTVPEHPVQRAIRSGKPQFVPDVQAEAEAMAHDERHAKAIHELANTSGIVVPLRARGRTFGAITFGTVAPQPQFTEYDLALATEIGRRASAALDNALLYQASEERASASEALEFVDDGVVLVDRGDVVRLINPAAARTFSVKPAKAVGRRLDDVVEDWQTVRDRLGTSLRSRPGRAEMLPLVVQGRERWLSVSAVRFPGGTVYAFRDMTEERAVEQLKSDFVSTVSHELRTPLAAIYGAALTLQRDDVRLEESQRSGLLDVISSEADRLARIVNDILWASRLDSGQMSVAIESCNAEALTGRVVDALRAHAPDTVTLSIIAQPGLPPVAADPDKLRQVLTNLVDNAVKYSPDGGEVRVALSTAGGRVRIRVEDQGLGIPAAEHTRIFEKFFRLDPDLTRGVGGTGLGLYICRELVHRMHGRIWVVSDGRHGSTFSVELPIAE
jgi:PAS domain S-box-containing protein